MPTSRPAPFADRLLAWWEDHGRKDLPWQHPRTPYRVWVSEIMLQQTQVTTVIPYFERWMRSYPDVRSLAEAPLDDVLAHWAGLGYYARARNLHKTALICAELHDGALPEGADALASLPGIGLSTANAIVSQSTDQPAAVLDGNVRRVLARHAGIEGWSGKSAVQKALWAEAENRLPDKRGADYTQAVMDLGATLCVRTSPDCSECPVHEDCQALATDRVAELPTPKPKTRVTEVDMRLAIVRNPAGEVLLQRRPPSGIWGGLWCLPLDEELGVNIDQATDIEPFQHRLSHRLLTISPRLIHSVSSEGVECPGHHQWFSPDQWNNLGLPKPIAELLKRITTEPSP